jgi:ubiquinone biosynthesis protein UbiJ
MPEEILVPREKWNKLFQDIAELREENERLKKKIDHLTPRNFGH